MDTTRPSLLLRIRDRSDGDAWRTFDAIYRPMLYRLAAARGLDHADADDIAQHCLSAVADHIRQFDYDPLKGRFKSWLRTLINNRIRNFYRDRRERPLGSAELGGLAHADPSPEQDFERIWMEEHLRHCLESLRAEVEPATFSAFRYYVIEQWPIERVCEELNLTPNNVYTIKWRLTEKVAVRMKELLGDDA